MTSLVDCPGDHFVNNPFVDFGTYMRPEAHLVHVSGSGPNIFGHSLLCFDVSYGYYAHVHKPGWNYPSVIMGENAFQTYLKDEKKNVLKREEIILDDDKIVHAQIKLKRRLGKKYFWGGALHNCAEWVTDIINAGLSHNGQLSLTSAGMSLPTLMISKSVLKTNDGRGDYHRLY